jgi:hypothetical protein
MSGAFDPYHKWLGIPPKDSANGGPNLYRLLGIELFEHDPDVIENAADQRMRHVRSFQVGQHAAESQALLNEIAAARVRLLDPRQRQVYDATLATTAPLSKTPQASVVPIPVVIPLANVPPSPPPLQPVLPQAPVAARPIPVLLPAPQTKFRRRRWLSRRVVAMLAALGTAGLVVVLVFAALLRPRGESVPSAHGVTANRRQSGNPATDRPPPPPAPPSKLAPLQGTVDVGTVAWQRGDPPLDLGPAKESFVVTSFFGGHYLGGGEWYRIDIDAAGHYRVHGAGIQPVGVSVTRIRSPYRAWFEDKVEPFTWHKGSPRVQLIHERDGFAVLSGAIGCFLDHHQSIRLAIDPADGYWYLQGTTNHETQGQALVYRFKEPGKLAAEVRHVPWHPGHVRERIFPTEEGLCTVSAATGAFHGFGEQLNALAEADGHWYVWGLTSTSTMRGEFTAIRLNTPAMLALSPAKPEVKMAEKGAP